MGPQRWPGWSAIIMVAVGGIWIGGCTGETIQPNGGVAPVTETCDDRVDNDNDKLVDCDDPDCELIAGCVDEPPDQLDLLPEWPVCASAKGDRSTVPVDILWTVDSSPSMQEEMGWIQQNLNDFVEYLTGITMDVKVVLLGGEQICVPEPLAGPGCTDGQRLRHIREYVGSHDSLRKIVGRYPTYRGFLRDGRKALVMTTDDNSEVGAAWFTSQIGALEAPGFGDDYVVHSIVAYGTHPNGCLTGAAAGTVYLDLSDATGGIKYPICETDWTQVFAKLAEGIVGMVDLPCAYSSAATLPADMTVDPAQVHVVITEADQQRVLGRVQGAGECGQGGWFYEAGSGTVRLCPESCQSLQTSSVQVSFGCHQPVN